MYKTYAESINNILYFYQDYISPCPGPIVDIDSGKVICSHQGVHLFTLGQRVRLNGIGIKLFVADKDSENSTVYVCRGPDHPALFTETFFTGPPHWIDLAPPELTDRQRDRTLVRTINSFKNISIFSFGQPCCRLGVNPTQLLKLIFQNLLFCGSIDVNVSLEHVIGKYF